MKQFTKRIHILPGTLGLLTVTATQLLSGQSSDKPNIIIIYADDLGYGDVSCYGATSLSTPNIDRLAKQGLRFTNAHCTSATSTPSRYSLLTGEYAWRRKGTDVLPGDASAIIQTGRTTGKENPELLKIHPCHGHDMTIVNGISRIGYMTGGRSALWVDENIADVMTDKAVKYIEPGPGVKLNVNTNTETGNDPLPQLYNLKTDLGEKNNVASQNPLIVNELTDLLSKIRNDGRTR